MSHGEKYRKGVGGVIAIIFILSAILIVFSIMSYNILVQSKLSEIQESKAESSAEKVVLARSVSGTWYYDEDNSRLTINITNNHKEPVSITGIVIYYTDKSYQILRENILGKIIVDGTYNAINSLPIWLSPGEKLNIELISDKIPTAVTYAVATSKAVTDVSAQKYVPTQVNVTSITYSVKLMPVVAYEGTVTTLGYAIEFYNSTISSTEIVLGSPVDTDINALYSDDNYYFKVEGERVVGEWRYRRPITVTELSGNSISNYAVKIVLNSSNFDFSHAKPDGSDIKFTLSDGVTEIPYWIETWNSTKECAVIWVKIPELQGGSSTVIYMYYGNPNAISKSDPDKVFIFYDDFLGDSINTTKWVVTGEGIFDVTDSTFIGYAQSSTEYVYTVEPIIQLNPPMNIAVEFKMRGSVNRDWDSGIAIGTPGGTLVGFTDDYFIDRVIDYAGDDFFAGEGLTISNLWWNTLDIRDIGLVSITSYHLYRVVISETGSTFEDLNVTNRVNEDSRSPTGHLWIVNDGDGRLASNVIIDWIRVRPYVTPEPSVVVGEEEENVKYEVELVVNYTNIPSNAIALNVTSILKSNTTIGVTIELWDYEESSWDTIITASYSDINTETTYYDVVAVNHYVFNGKAKLKLKTESTTPNLLSIDLLMTYYSILTSEGMIYVGIGGSNSFYVYDIDSDSWSSLSSAPFTFCENSSITFDPIRGYIWAISLSGGLTTLYKYSIISNSWSIEDSNVPFNVGAGTSILYYGNKLYVVTGGSSELFYMYDIEAKSWSRLNDILKPVGDYGVAEIVNNNIYVIIGGGDEGFYKYDISTNMWSEITDTSPTIYPVGLTYDSDLNVLWLIGKGGGLFYYNIAQSSWSAYNLQPPYTPEAQGNRLEYYNGKLYHVRDDGTRELWIIDI